MSKLFSATLLLAASGLLSLALAADEFKNAKVQINAFYPDKNKLRLNIAVWDAAGKPLGNLGWENIKIYYAGKRLAIDSLASMADAQSRSIILAIDFSGSMDTYVGGKTKFQSAREAVIAYMDSVITSTDEVAIVAFDSLVHSVCGFERDKNKLRQSLTQAKRHPHGTALLEGIRFSLELLRSGAGAKLLIVITDGMDTEFAKRLRKQLAEQGMPVTNEAEQIDPLVRAERKKLIAMAGKDKIKVFTIGIGERQASGLATLDTTFLQELARTTAGTYSYQDLTPLPRSQVSNTAADALRSGLLEIFRRISHASLGAAGNGEYHLVLSWNAREVFDYKRMSIRLSKPLLEKLSLNETLLVFVMPLLLLLIIPSLAAISFDGIWFTCRWVKTAKPELKIKNDWDDKPLFERICSYCRMNFQNGQKIVICPQCKTVHHTDCWTSNDNHCAARVGCAGYGKPFV